MRAVLGGDEESSREAEKWTPFCAGRVSFLLASNSAESAGELSSSSESEGTRDEVSGAPTHYVQQQHNNYDEQNSKVMNTGIKIK